jgi:DNA-binding NtrC family response regulator
MVTPRQILHIDDDRDVTSLVAEYLKDHGYAATAINDPREVILQLPKHQERMILLDIDMPHINGLDLLKQIKAFDGGIQVVMLTGLVNMTTVLQALRWGAEACFFKPIIDVAPLVEAFDDCFRKIDRWWTTLSELTRNQKANSSQPPHGFIVV